MLQTIFIILVICSWISLISIWFICTGRIICINREREKAAWGRVKKYGRAIYTKYDVLFSHVKYKIELIQMVDITHNYSYHEIISNYSTGELVKHNIYYQKRKYYKYNKIKYKQLK